MNKQRLCVVYWKKMISFWLFQDNHDNLENNFLIF